ncbi:MAG: hypothetical protein LQ351_000771 [Letrouitia transgressa]|nr:MAG: hypothetical protein LQ351_000771 [Letrouitia transgressa]
MVATRGSQGITAPRIPFTPAIAPQSRVAATKKPKSKKAAGAGGADGAKPKANTSKPRASAKDKTATGRVAKPKAAAAAAAKKDKAPKTKNRRDPSLLDKVAGVAEKVVGVIEGKPGKKAAGTKKIKGTDGKGAKRAKKE